MQLATDSINFSDGPLGMVELALSYLNDRKKRYYSKAEIIEYINQAQAKVANMITRKHREYWLTSATTPMVAGQAVYSLPSDLVKLWEIDVLDDLTDATGKTLVSVPMIDHRFYELLEDANRKEDYDFYFVAGTTFKTMPAPGTVTAEQVRVHYVKRLTALANNTDVSEIPVDHHELLCIDAARRGYIKTNRRNQQLESMWAEGVSVMESQIQTLQPNAEFRVKPFYGTYGPGQDIWEHVFGQETVD